MAGTIVNTIRGQTYPRLVRQFNGSGKDPSDGPCNTISNLVTGARCAPKVTTSRTFSPKQTRGTVEK